MRRLTGVILLILALALMAPAVSAQEEHGEFGVYADYTRFHNLNNQNFWGLGGNLGFNLGRFVQLEGTMAYDFERNFVSSTSTSFGTTGSFQNTGFRILNGYFGPKFQTGVGPMKVFASIKPGFDNFSITNRGVVTGFANAVSNVPEGNTHFALFPSGGVEYFFTQRIGVRVEAGDNIYWENGAHNNLNLRFGPQFRW
jgi:outer membrane protein with beta-barrel domain